MNELIRMLREDTEIQELKKACYDITGKWIPYHWECFASIEEYKEYMRQVIKERYELPLPNMQPLLVRKK